MKTDIVKNKYCFAALLKKVLGAALLFASVLVFLPNAGLLRTFPLLFAAGAASGFFGLSCLFGGAFVFVLSVCFYLVNTGNVMNSFVFSAIACVFSVSGFYFVKFVGLSKKTENKTVVKKCKIISAVLVLLTVALSLIFCGNPFSFVKHDSENTSHIAYVNKSDKLGVQKRFTAFDVFSGEYRTYVKFIYEDIVVGNDNESYISRKNGKLTDSVRDYYETEMLIDAKRHLANAVALGNTGDFEVTCADIPFEDGQLLGPEDKYDAYKNRIAYVVSFYSILDDKTQFEFLCNEAVSALKKSEFEFDKIVFCGGNANEVLYNMNVDRAFNTSGTEMFEEDVLEGFGITREDVLSYWKNM